MSARPALFAVALGLLLATGCRPAKLNETKTLTLDMKHAAQGVKLDAQKKPQTVTVEFSSSDGEVTVCVFKQDDLKDDDDMAMTEDKKALGRKKGKAESFSVEIPENTATCVVVRGHTAAKTDVTVKVANAK
jgi:hypothetical protein